MCVAAIFHSPATTYCGNVFAGLENAQKVFKRETRDSVWLVVPSSATSVSLQETYDYQYLHG